MPELPEAETIRRDLQALMPGSVINQAKLLETKSSNLGKTAFAVRLKGMRIKSIGRLGKALVIDLGEIQLMVHLKMTGQLVWISDKQAVAGGHPIANVGKALPNKFTRAWLRTDRGTLFFNDVRKFGWIRQMGEEDLLAYSKRLGPEPLAAGFNVREFKKSMKEDSSIPVKAALLDQTRISGLGNIYADEALFRAGISPKRKLNSLTDNEWASLAKAVKAILEQAIKHRGTSFSDYVDAGGRQGNFVRHLKVYGRGGQACPGCGQTIRKEKFRGRGTHWCDNCQK